MEMEIQVTLIILEKALNRMDIFSIALICSFEMKIISHELGFRTWYLNCLLGHLWSKSFPQSIFSGPPFIQEPGNFLTQSLWVTATHKILLWMYPQLFDSFCDNLKENEQCKPQIFREMELTWEYRSLYYKSHSQTPLRFEWKIRKTKSKKVLQSE